MRVHFTLKRKGWGYDDVYEALKSGEKRVEWRPASDFWISRLINKGKQESFKKALKFFHDPMPAIIGKGWWKYDKAKFVVGYTKYPRLYADIYAMFYHPESKQFSIQVTNVIEYRIGIEENVK